ncbi:DNA repair protein RecN [Pediococcus acidilactici]|jgi:DNA repair protein RecN (Recombination protein N)|uniref:DNA repair protein RecN n=1 Tax=Pediococcus acidilactici TaxID=1254 RepID=UPI000463185D|nr:DNA repair protein RecN [Pediococcus acidilactici]KAF0335436.1 DNA repair protein RecN [Pediococcus acidilactici]KAF0347064.1 DNA repair protein RecN [Pediococcus acidilactici]KAF0394747.1 DNA repair protein RecN [Pediococcus acidilactici]KAF0398593.1 DNA repair protein RecN [Pediococcus acidilactici]KAF0411743.1 DNA repair protein RecN [Pediococcus acidilactici]
MLLELSIKDFAIIEKLDASFRQGMTVLTGETGAGKSIIIDAVGLLAGGRGSVDFVRTGADKAVLQGVFDIAEIANTKTVLEELGIEPTNDLVITRELLKTGRSVCRVNGTIVNLNSLKKIGQTLIDIHGQNEHQELMDSDKHLRLLEQFDYAAVADTKQRYQAAFKAYTKLNRRLNQSLKNEHEWNQRVDMLQFQVDEIKAANLIEGEDEELEKRRDQLVNFQSISDALAASFQVLESEEGVSATDQIGNVMQEMQGIADYDEEYEQIADEVQNAYYSLEDVTNRVRSAIDSMEWNPAELDEVEQRLETIRQLKKKYGNSITEILKYLSRIENELAEMTGAGQNLDDLAVEVEKRLQETKQLGTQLTNLRQKMALKLEQAVRDQLAGLYMEKTQFKVQFNSKKVPELDGLDNVEFLIQPNPGEDLKPLAKIASGGELSRIMLALKTIFARNEGVTSIIFDEVDTGVSGRVAQAIADKIHEISNHSQVLCISHLPQVAARADYQLHVAKKVVKGRTMTNLTALDDEGRVNEIAKMLAGVDLTELSLEHARELLQMEHEQA